MTSAYCAYHKLNFRIQQISSLPKPCSAFHAWRNPVSSVVKGREDEEDVSWLWLRVPVGDRDDQDGTLIAAMLSRLGHRGPDATEVAELSGTPAVMGHCRLSIIGAENGRQPIRAGAEMLVANGEIYNHEDLRAILGAENLRYGERQQKPFFTCSAPVRSAGSAGSTACSPSCWQTPDRIIAARDPLGIKPLYMARRGKGLAFASELKAFDGLGFEENQRRCRPGALRQPRRAEAMVSRPVGERQKPAGARRRRGGG